MIVCDRAYLRELERRMKAAKRELPRDVAKGIDAEIEAIEAQGDPDYSAMVMGVGFRLELQDRLGAGAESLPELSRQLT